MCGIAGIYNYESCEPVSVDVLKKMADSIRHRGPDDEGYYVDDAAGVGFCHRRLSIIDLLTGQQPMSNAKKSIWIIFNGEIYNFIELKKDLQADGHTFYTKSDTEVIINLYEKYGINGFSKLNGIFAFAIYDKRDRSVILSRDRFGVKPLYYTIMNGKLLFSSEIKAIFRNPIVDRGVDYESVSNFFTFRYNSSPQTLFRNIKKLEPGKYLKVTSTGKVDLNSYSDDSPKINNKISISEAVEEYQRLFEIAVRRQMISDVPVGLLLSGGVDSAAIGYLMQQENKNKIKTFTIGFSGKGDFNELYDAKKTAEFIGSDHHEMIISQKEYLDFFIKSTYYTEEPIAQVSIPLLYYVSKLASSYLKVVLTGQGADEPLAGYKRYLGEKYISKYFPILRLVPLRMITKILPRNERFKRAVYASKFNNELERFLAIYTIFTPEEKSKLFIPEIKEKIKNNNLNRIGELYKQTSNLKDTLSKLLFIDTRLSLSDNLLLFGDKMSMAHSLEMRVPFLDIELVQFIESLPSTMKLKGLTHKFIHKKAVTKWLPSDIIHRKKRAFTTPLDEWLQSSMANYIKELFNDDNSAVRKYFDISYINLLINQHQLRKYNHERKLLSLLAFEFWCKNFFENINTVQAHDVC
jgi:asparagine synthase (glutamine-hydrolysing)